MFQNETNILCVLIQNHKIIWSNYTGFFFVDTIFSFNKTSTVAL
jgi:hypothetical protein